MELLERLPAELSLDKAVMQDVPSKESPATGCSINEISQLPEHCGNVRQQTRSCLRLLQRRPRAEWNKPVLEPV